jgi:hypothetical protein
METESRRITASKISPWMMIPRPPCDAAWMAEQEPAWLVLQAGVATAAVAAEPPNHLSTHGGSGNELKRPNPYKTQAWSRGHDRPTRRHATPRHAKRGRRRAGPDPDPDPSCHPVTHRLLAPTGHHHRTRPLARGAPLQPQLPVKSASHLALLSPPLSPLCPLSQFPGPDLGS